MSFDRQKILDAAQKFVARGMLDKAVAEYALVLREDPGDVRVMLKIGDLQVRMNTHREAIDTYARVARTYEQQQDYRKAIAVYKQILQIDPDQATVQRTLAELFIKLNLPTEAMQQFDVLAQKLSRTPDTETLQSVYQRMVLVDPNNIAVHIRFAELLSHMGRSDQAILEFETGCRLLQTAGRMDDWARVAERLFFHRPNDAALARKLAAYYLERSDARRALPRLQVAYKANPRDIDTLDLLARAFRELGQIPKTVSVLKEMARIHGEAGRARERIETYQRVLDLAPTDAEAREAHRAGSRVGRKPASIPPPIAVAATPAPSPVDTGSSVLRAPPLPAAATEADPGDEVIVEEDDVVFDLKPSIAPSESQPGVRVPSNRPSPRTTPETANPIGTSPLHGVSPPGVDALPPGRKTPASVPTEINRLLGEADIFLKYGLKAKAVSHLHRAAQLDPASMEIHGRLRELFAGLDDRTGVVRESVAIARFLEATDVEGALAEVAHALEIDPSDAEARQLHDRLAGAEVPVPEATIDATLLDESDVMLADESPSDVLEAYADETRTDFIPPGLGGPYGFEDVTERGPSLPEEDKGASHDAQAITHNEGAGANALRREIEEGLDEAEFFVSQGLYDDARDTLYQLLTLYPHHPLVVERWEEVEQLVAAQTYAGEEDRSFALAEKLAEEIDGLGVEATHPSSQIDVETVFAQFKQEVGRQVSIEDCDTHYDLGIAYKEMGLYDDAVAEFKIATMNPARRCIGETMIGLCYEEKGDYPAAVEHFKLGLQASQRTEQEELGLYFEIAAAYEHLGDGLEALYFYQKVSKRDPGFRDVTQKMHELQAQADGSPNSVAPGIEDVDLAFDELLKG